MLYNIFVIYFFFFFQAEDGIRDRDVTGVQTCALPITLLIHGQDQPESSRTRVRGTRWTMGRDRKSGGEGKGVELGGGGSSEKKKSKNMESVEIEKKNKQKSKNILNNNKDIMRKSCTSQ